MKKLIAIAMLAAGATGVWANGAINMANPVAGSGWTVSGSVVRIVADGFYSISGTTTSNRLEIAAGVTATIVLNNANITSSVASPLTLSPTGCNVTMELVGNSKLSCSITGDIGVYCAALQVEGSANLTIEGEGSLTATGGAGGAGIGSAWTGRNTGNIIINGGNVNATGGYMSAGIGGGTYATGGNITILDGNITATGGNFAAAIGGGTQGDGGNILIAGGNIIANGAYMAAGIGGGSGTSDGNQNYPGGDGGNINISGGFILALGGGFSPGIGSGYLGNSAGNIQITGGAVYAWAGGNSAGIGAGVNSGADGSISIAAGTVVSNRIGLVNSGWSGGPTPTTITGGAIIADTINATAFGNANVANYALDYDLFILLADIAKSNAFIELHDTTLTTLTHHDTTTLTPHHHDTLTRILHDTFILVEHQTLPSDQTFRLEYHDTVNLATRDTLEIIHTFITHDTLHIPTPIPERIDTLYAYSITVHDTLFIPVAGLHDTLYLIRDTLYLPDIRHLPEYIYLHDTTTLHDTILVHTTLTLDEQSYIVVDPAGLEHPAPLDPHVSPYGLDGIRISECYGFDPIVIYDLQGKVIISAYVAGHVYLRDPFPHGIFLLHSNNNYTHFTH